MPKMPTRTSTKRPPRTRARTAAPKAGAVSERSERTVPDIPELLKTWKPQGVYGKLAFIQAYVPPVEETGHVEMKTQKGGTVSYDHMQEHGLLECLRPFFRELKCGYYPSFNSVTHSGNHTFIDGTLTFFDAEPTSEYENTVISVNFHNEGIDSGDKGSNKTMTAWVKYALQKFFAIPTKDLADTEGTQDPSTAAAQTTSLSVSDEAEIAELRKTLADAIQAGDLTQNRVQSLLQGTYGVTTLGDLTPAQRGEVANTLLGPKG